MVAGSEAGGDSASASAPCCASLAHIYAAQPFREWWNEPARTRAPERLQWMDYRSKGVDLLEYVREAHRSMKVLERALETRLHAIWADEAPRADAASVEAGSQLQGDVALAEVEPSAAPEAPPGDVG